MSGASSPLAGPLSQPSAQQLVAGTTGKLAQDQHALDGLKRVARDNPQAAVRQAAVQFESLFVQMVLKNMRDSSIKSGMMDSPANDMYTGMLDQEMSLKVAGGSTGLTDVIVHQLSRNLPGGDAGALPGAAGALNPLPPRSQSSLSSISALSPRSLSMLLLQDQDDGSGEPTIDASAAAASDPADPIDPDAGHQSGAAPADGSADRGSWRSSPGCARTRASPSS